jgi:hypothetical protein
LEQEIVDGWMVKSAFTHDLQGGGGGGGGWWWGDGCAVHRSTSGSSTEGARQSWCPARHQGGSRLQQRGLLLVAERIDCAIVGLLWRLLRPW